MEVDGLCIKLCCKDRALIALGADLIVVPGPPKRLFLMLPPWMSRHLREAGSPFGELKEKE